MYPAIPSPNQDKHFTDIDSIHSRFVGAIFFEN